MIDLHALLLSPSGRIGRQTFWHLIAALVAAQLILSLIPLLGTLAALVLLWPFSCVIAQRLHDSGRRAWLLIPVALLSAASGLLAFAIGAMRLEPAMALNAFALAGLSVAIGGLATLAALALLLYAGLARGDAGANRFGAPEAEPLSLAALTR